ncbi:hypothetical protein AYL99_00940 [Fonsecaea erecta]|uniref:Uncharacterized protein n=1 Tax=Fonsecaea erecta TaxID=1367422 RepID=A0A178ZYS5_9EURO|nr:hypothetical protein AYL99_00940 [Fonsecaea erecta]OAP64968.1 hypothetical protein AYL99_00940 [Fonsecaea erecta]
MSLKADGPRVRPERVKPPPPSSPPTEAHPNPPSWSRRSSTASTTSFHSAHSVQLDRFSPAEESRMLSRSNDLKSQANTLFSRQDYESAIQTYDRALAELPRYLDYERAVLQSNIAACHLKLDQWKDAVDCCERGLDGLERELPTKKKEVKAKKRTGKGAGAKKSSSTAHTNGKSRNGRLNSDSESDDEGASPAQSADQAVQDDTVVELPSDEEDETAALNNLQLSDTRKADITRIRVKLLLRRARARSNMSLLPPSSSTAKSSATSDLSSTTSASKASSAPTTSAWSNLSSALEDYKTLSSTPQYWETLPAFDKRTVRDALVLLPPKIEEAKQKEVSEMMGKLKDLGNGILRPFGLSTDNFKVVQGEGGGYSLSFDGGGKKG